MTTKTGKHTPIPWKISALSEGKWWSYGIYQVTNNAILGEANKDDANFIKTACNNHENLLKGCKDSLNVFINAQGMNSNYQIVKQLQEVINNVTKQELP